MLAQSERILVGLMVVVAVLGAIPQAMFLPASLVLVLLGLLNGALNKSRNATDRIVIYVAAIALPVFSNSLDAIPTIGPLVNQVLDHLATGVQGMAVAILVVAVYERIMPKVRY